MNVGLVQIAATVGQAVSNPDASQLKIHVHSNDVSQVLLSIVFPHLPRHITTPSQSTVVCILLFHQDGVRPRDVPDLGPG